MALQRRGLPNAKSAHGSLILVVVLAVVLWSVVGRAGKSHIIISKPTSVVLATPQLSHRPSLAQHLLHFCAQQHRALSLFDDANIGTIEKLTFIFVGDSTALQALRLTVLSVARCAVENFGPTNNSLLAQLRRVDHVVQTTLEKRISEFEDANDLDASRQQVSILIPSNVGPETRKITFHFLKAPYGVDVVRKLSRVTKEISSMTCSSVQHAFFVRVVFGNWDVIRPRWDAHRIDFAVPSSLATEGLELYERFVRDSIAAPLLANARELLSLPLARLCNTSNTVTRLRVVLPPAPNCTASKFTAGGQLRQGDGSDPYRGLRGSDNCLRHAVSGTYRRFLTAMRPHGGEWMRDTNALVTGGLCSQSDGSHIDVGERWWATLNSSTQLTDTHVLCSMALLQVLWS